MWLDLPQLEATMETRFIGRRLIYLTSTTSTMDICRAEAEAGAPEGTIVIAEEQTAGRGRFGRAWVSPAGKNIYFTLLLRPSAERLRRLSMLSPLAVAVAIEQVTGLSANIKWPNDVLISERKVSGILIDTELSGDEPRYALDGIGINVNVDIEPDSEISGIAASVKEELGREASREAILAAALNHIERLYEQEDADAVREAWKSRLDTLGKQVQVDFHGEVQEGLAEDVDAEGNLVLLRPDGTRHTFPAGEVSLRRPS